MGLLLTIDAIAIWNTGSVGAVSSFSLFADDDNIFDNGVTSLLLDSTALGASGPAQVFNFSSISTQFIHVNGLSSLQSPDYYGLGEVAFSQVAAVPEPSTIALLGLGLIGIGFSRKKKTV